MQSPSSMTASTSPPPISQPVVKPASLYSLTIYNPALGPTDETIHEQIVFHYGREDMLENEKLRQIGLAQGVAEFSKVFSKTENLSSVETEKSRIVLYEVEDNWWILAYIDLLRIQHHDRTEYSNKEVSPPHLLNAQLETAYEQFRFLYGGFQTAFTSLGRHTFCKKLDKFWSKWSWRWDVTLHGNPASEIWGGIKVAQPKIGGSMREVLDAFVEQEERNGLLDMVVARYGKAEVDALKETFKEASSEQSRAASGLSNLLFSASRASGKSPRTSSPKATDQYPREITASDGCIYLGRGKLHATSIRDISKWIANFYTFNDDGSASANSKRRKPKRPRVRHGSSTSLLREITTATLTSDVGISAPRSSRMERPMPRNLPEMDRLHRERPILRPSESQRDPKDRPRPSERDRGSEGNRFHRERPVTRLAEREIARVRRGDPATDTGVRENPNSTSPTGIEIGELTPPVRVRPRSLIAEHRDPSESRERSASTVHSRQEGSGPRKQLVSPANSTVKILDYLTFGWSGGRSREKDRERERSSRSPSEHDKSGEGTTWKITERAVWINHRELPLKPKLSPQSSNRGSREITSPEAYPQEISQQKADYVMDAVLTPNVSRSSTIQAIQNVPQLKQFRLVVYVNPPFIFALFFHPNTPHLAQPAYYRSLHLRLGPLRGPLVCHEEPEPETGKRSVYDLFFDPITLRQTCSIPNIPPHEPYGLMPDKTTPQFSRTDVINIHSQILCIYNDADKEKERKSRTMRGWWVAWNKLPGEREAVLAWKGGEGGKDREITTEGGDDVSGGGLFDTKRYLEVLMKASLRG